MVLYSDSDEIMVTMRRVIGYVFIMWQDVLINMSSLFPSKYVEDKVFHQAY